MKTDRLIGILTALLQEGMKTAPELARRFEVSRRTINRDIEALCRAGVPIVTTQGAKGGIAIMEGYRMDRTLLTEDDMRAIVAGLRGLDSVSATRRYARVIEKMSPDSAARVDADRVLINLASWYGDTLAQKIELIRAAMEAGRAVRFMYYGPKGEGVREAEPGLLVFRWSSWYLWGWCRKRKDFRFFKLNRMTSLVEADEATPRAVPVPDLSNARVFPGNYVVTALIAPEYRWRLIEEYGPECFEQRADGKLRFRWDFTDRGEAVSWILSFRGGAELIEPEALRCELAEAGRRVAALHDDGKE